MRSHSYLFSLKCVTSLQQKIIKSVENSAAYKAKRVSEYNKGSVHDSSTPQNVLTMDAIMKAARDVAEAVGAKAIVSFTKNGTSWQHLLNL